MRGIGFGSLWAFPNGLWTYGLNLIPILFLASITKNLGRLLILLVAFFGITAIWVGISWSIFSQLNLTTSSANIRSLVQWESLFSILFVLGFGIAYAIQSLYRNRRRSLKIAIATVFLAPLISVPNFRKAKEFPRTEGVTLSATDYIHQGLGNTEGQELALHAQFEIDDAKPSRVLVPIKANAILTSNKGGRQEHRSAWRNPLWDPVPFLDILADSGYATTTNPPIDSDQDFGVRLLKFKRNTPQAAFNGDASLKIECALSEYELLAIHERSVGERQNITANRLLTAIGRSRYSSNPTETSKQTGLEPLAITLPLIESRFVSRLVIDHSDIPEINRSGNVVRVYFLYDPINKLLSIGSPQFDRNRKFHVDSGSPFFGPNWERRHKFITFRFHYSPEMAIDRSQFKLIAIDVKKAGNRLLEHSMTIDDLAQQIEAIKAHESTNKRWDRVVPIK